MAWGHYETFPVASLLLPADLRPHVAAVYAFARAADDMADEGSDPPEIRLSKLDFWEACLEGCASTRTFAADCAGADVLKSTAGTAADLFPALADTIRRFNLSVQPFKDLLTAFRRDAAGAGYRTFEELLDYCEHSANPVGRILLALFGIENEKALASADDLCTGLQLANFWQDLSIDIKRGRFYIPDEDLLAFGCSKEELRDARPTEAFARLMSFEVERAKERLLLSAALPKLLPFRLRLELRAVRQGGLRILEKIARRGYYSVLHSRTKLDSFDLPIILFRAAAGIR